MPDETLLRNAVTMRNAFVKGRKDLKDSLREELERKYDLEIAGLKKAFEQSVVRAKEGGWSISRIAHSFGMKGTKFVYDILDDWNPDWRNVKLVDYDLPAAENNEARNFRMVEGWAFVDLFFPGTDNLAAGYYTYRFEDNKAPHFENGAVSDFASQSEETASYWNMNAHYAIVSLGKGDDYAEFKRKFLDPHNITENMIRAEWEKVND